jgi:hypothetical protein
MQSALVITRNVRIQFGFALEVPPSLSLVFEPLLPWGNYGCTRVAPTSLNS